MKIFKNRHNAFFPLMILVLSLFIVSCMEDSGRGGRALKTGSSKSAQTDVTPALCKTYYSVQDNSCSSDSCPFGSHKATNTELAAALYEIQNSPSIPSDSRSVLLSNFNSAQFICLEGSGILRPDKQVSINENYCACRDTKADILNNCEGFCSTKNTGGAPMLFGSVTLGPDILLNPVLGNLYNWCTQQIPGSDYTAPSCVLEAWDGESSTPLEITVFPNSNNFKADLTQLEKGIPYVLKIVESGSTSNVSSNEFNLYRFKNNDTDQSKGTLKVTSVSQYTCVTRAGKYINSDKYYENALRIHFYYNLSNEPPALPPTDGFVLCHDPLNGLIDNPRFPRLENRPSHFMLWDANDYRFYATKNGTSPDINAIIQNRLLIEENEQREVNLFSFFKWHSYPPLSNANIPDESAGVPIGLGMVMQPIIDQDTRKSFCPKREDGLNSNDKMIRMLMNDYIGTDTEAVYLSEKEKEILKDSNGVPVQVNFTDRIIIREGMLKKLWFYLDNGRHLTPNDATAASRTVHFYWPPDVANPYVKKPEQRQYTVRHPEDIGKGGSTSLPTNIPPHDKRFGCVPAIND